MEAPPSPASAASSPPTSAPPDPRRLAAVPRLVRPGRRRPRAPEEPADGLIPRHQPTLAEVGRTAAFLASDWARTITAAEINLTGGAVVD